MTISKHFIATKNIPTASLIIRDLNEYYQK